MHRRTSSVCKRSVKNSICVLLEMNDCQRALDLLQEFNENDAATRARFCCLILIEHEVPWSGSLKD